MKQMAGVGGSAGHPADDENDETSDPICLEQHDETTTDGFMVTVCTRGHETAPFVRVPPDVVEPDGRVVYAGLRLGTSKLALRGKEEITISAEDMKLFEMEYGHAMILVPDRYAYAIYKIQLDAANAIRKFEPSVIIDGSVLAAAFLTGKHFEGLISAKVEEDNYDTEPKLPIVFEFASTATSTGGARGNVVGRIEATIKNLSESVALADGTCAPSLTSYGARNPIPRMAPFVLAFERISNMHGAFDDVFDVSWPEGGSSMSRALYVEPALLLGTDPPNQAGQVSPHGPPAIAPSMSFAPAEASSKTCP